MIRSLLCSLVVGFAGFISLNAQESTAVSPEGVSLFGVMKIELSGEPISGGLVALMLGSDTISFFETGADGKVDMLIPYGAEYKIIYSFPNYASKSLLVDTRHVPDFTKEEGFGLDVDISLPPLIPNFDFSLLDEPIGLVMYDAGSDNFSFDNPYTRKKIKQYLAFKTKLAEARNN